MDPTTEAVLCSDYNHWRAQTWHIQKVRKQRPIRDHSLKKTHAIFSAVSRWCGERKIDPRRWIYFRFASRHWKYAPPLDQLIPSEKGEKKALVAYRLLGETPAFSDRIHNEIRFQRDETGISWDVNRDISHLAEAIKRRYLATNDWQLCMGRMGDQTFGFHPKSRVCQRCPGAGVCAEHLQRGVPFDIVALRRGDVSLRSCYAAAARGTRGQFG